MTDVWPLRVAGLDTIPASKADTSFLRDLFLAVHRDTLGHLPLPENAIATMMEQQFQAQSISFREDHPAAADWILMKDGQRIGRLLVDHQPGAAHIVDLAILPDHQSQGLGSRVLTALTTEAQTRQAQVRLRVLHGQPAQRLYARLGFEVTGSAPPYDDMQWTPR